MLIGFAKDLSTSKTEFKIEEDHLAADEQNSRDLEAQTQSGSDLATILPSILETVNLPTNAREHCMPIDIGLVSELETG